MEQPTPEQVAVARERLVRWYGLAWAVEPMDYDAPTIAGASITILAHLDAVGAERDANRHELDQLVQETLIPLQQELAEARGRIEALSTLLEWNREAMEAFGVTGGPDITDAIQWAQQQKQALAEARAAIKEAHYTSGIDDHPMWQSWRNLPAVKRAMEASDADV